MKVNFLSFSASENIRKRLQPVYQIDWFVGWCDLWYINPCRFFNSKLCLRIYVLSIYDLLVGWMCGFYGISTLVGYLMVNLVHTYISNICVL